MAGGNNSKRAILMSINSIQLSPKVLTGFLMCVKLKLGVVFTVKNRPVIIISCHELEDFLSSSSVNIVNESEIDKIGSN